MNKLFSGAFKYVIPFGIMTGLHFYDDVSNHIKLDKIAITISIGIVYFVIIRPKTNVQKARELDEDKSKDYSVKVQAMKTARVTSTLLLIAGILLFAGNTINEIGLTLALTAASYSIGGGINVYDISKKTTN